MDSLAIRSIGAFTSVGEDASMTMASILSGIQLFDDLELRGEDGEPVTGAVTPVARRLRGASRLGGIGLAAVRDCASSPPDLAASRWSSARPRHRTSTRHRHAFSNS
jgi:hypothetical protein